VPSQTKSLLLIALMIVGLLPAARAGSIDAIYAFGDSLSDVGNVYTVTGGAIPGPPYVNGQFSNGPVWVQGLAAGLGLAPLAPSQLGGTDYAYGSAETGPTAFNTSVPLTDLTGPTGQLAQFGAAHSTADPNALYTIWIGSNDLIDILTGASPSQYASDIGAAVTNVDTAIGTLAASGAKNFLIVTVPDLGLTPLAIAGGSAAQAGASSLALGFNNALVSSAVTLASVDSLNLSVLDTYSLLDAIVANKSIYGFANVTDPCVTGAVNYVGGTACAATTVAQDQYLFWDTMHPTAAGHAVIADAALAVVTPEPASVSLIAGGLVAIGLAFRLRRAA
jgi:phospholipase/lecithinase/hemolysin